MQQGGIIREHLSCSVGVAMPLLYMKERKGGERPGIRARCDPESGCLRSN